eukprot:c14864_g1_i2.p1 GENE.c14864_g1_i2~~c14864_g1_i2.p1  ORF type:complete len:340 (+),score=42.90 c14864_g1_i2:60-1079(+)
MPTQTENGTPSQGNDSSQQPTLLDLIFEEDTEGEGLSYHQHLVAGAIAGITEHCIVFPIDTIKTRMQVLTSLARPPPCETTSFTNVKVERFHAGFMSTLRTFTQVEGVSKLFRGISAMALGAGPSHAVYFASYEKTRSILGGGKPGNNQVLANAASGAIATVMSDAILVPMDTVKQRMQVYKSPYKNLSNVVSSMVREEGFFSLYASYKTTLFMNIPFFAIQLATYHTAKDLLGSDSHGNASFESVVSHWVSGGLSGATAAAFTTPLDVIRTRLQTQGLEGRVGAQRFRGTRHVARHIMNVEGIRGFTNGWLPRVLFHVPGSAICWATYELCKDLFAEE